MTTKNTVPVKRGRPRKETEHYVDNDALYRTLKAWKQAKNEAKEQGKPPPRVPESVGRDIMLIAQNYATQRSFAQYPFITDMIYDAVENCIRYIDNYDPDKTNPFAYFSTIIYYSFLRTIKKERKALYLKYKAIDMSGMSGIVGHDSEYYDSTDGDSSAYSSKTNEARDTFIDSFEKANQKKKKVGKK